MPPMSTTPTSRALSIGCARSGRPAARRAATRGPRGRTSAPAAATPARAAQRDGQRIVDDQAGILGDQRVVGAEADPEQRVERRAADEGRLVARNAVAVAEDEGRAPRADRQPGDASASRSAPRPSGRPAPRSAAGIVERGEEIRGEQLVGPVAVEIDGVDRVGDAGRIGDRPSRSASPSRTTSSRRRQHSRSVLRLGERRAGRTSVTRSRPSAGGPAVAPGGRA